MRVLHLLSQRPDSPGNGIYMQEIIKKTVKKLGTKIFCLQACLQLKNLSQMLLTPIIVTFSDLNPKNCPFLLRV